MPAPCQTDIAHLNDGTQTLLMKIDLTGKIAIITGAAGGLGQAESLAFAEAGANTIGVHVETCPHLHRTLVQVREAGTEVASLVKKIDQRIEFVRKISETMGADGIFLRRFARALP